MKKKRSHIMNKSKGHFKSYMAFKTNSNSVLFETLSPSNQVTYVTNNLLRL